MSGRIDDAYAVLKASDQDSDAQLKRKYRAAIRLCHPDSTGSEEALEEAKRINEAYERIVKYRAKKSASGTTRRRTAGYYSKKPAENPAAYCARTLYKQADPFGDYDGAQQPVEAGEGRFLWDPDTESFAFLMMSVRRKCMDLLRGAGVSEYGDGMLRLFHLLMREYICPWECLKKLSDDLQCVRVDESGRVHIDAETVITHSRNIHDLLDDIEEGDEVRLMRTGERFSVYGQDAERPIGNLSFAEDALYYLLLMLYESGRMQLRLTVRKKKIRKDVLPYTGLVLLDLEITNTHPEAKERPENHSLEISEILGRCSS